MTRHVGWLGFGWAALALVAPGATAQDGGDWRQHFAAGEEARVAGDADVYAREMAEAADAMPAGLLNRPFVQYHAARAAALTGRPGDALAFLRTTWEEDIESLMISFAAYDPAFEELRAHPGFRKLMERPAGLELSVRPLADGVYLVQGAGSNVVAVRGDEGVVLFDTGYAPALPALRRTLAAYAGASVSHVVVTHPHEDHMGATPSLGREAVVVAHPGTGEAMGEPYVFVEDVTLPPKPESALPDVEVARDTSLVLGGIRLRLAPTVAHTNGDLSVYLPDARVAHLGDTYLAANPMMYPGTEDPEAFLRELEAFLDLMAPETVVVGGHGEPAEVAAVRGQIATTRSAMDLVRQALADDLSLEETVARGEGRFPAPWIAFLYRTLGEADGWGIRLNPPSGPPAGGRSPTSPRCDSALRPCRPVALRGGPPAPPAAAGPRWAWRRARAASERGRPGSRSRWPRRAPRGPAART